MKIKINFLNLSLTFFLLLCVFSFSANASAQAISDLQPDNWAIVGLLISEIASLVSRKYSGIIQTVFLLAQNILKKKK